MAKGSGSSCPVRTYWLRHVRRTLRVLHIRPGASLSSTAHSILATCSSSWFASVYKNCTASACQNASLRIEVVGVLLLPLLRFREDVRPVGRAVLDHSHTSVRRNCQAR